MFGGEDGRMQLHEFNKEVQRFGNVFELFRILSVWHSDTMFNCPFERGTVSPCIEHKDVRYERSLGDWVETKVRSRESSGGTGPRFTTRMVVAALIDVPGLENGQQGVGHD